MNNGRIPKSATALSAGTLVFLFLLSFSIIPAHAATTYTVTVQTDQASYTGTQPVKITGTVSPAPGPNTGVVITIKNQTGAVADIDEVIPSATNGSFSYTSIPGGNPAWGNGTFSVNATWGGNGATASDVATFTYSPAATSTTSSSSSTSSSTTSSTSSSTTSTTSTTNSTSTTSSSTTTTSSVPEFPSSVLAVLGLIGMAAVGILSKRITLRPAA